MAEKIHRLTKDGYKQLEKKLKQLRTINRAEIAERIRQAKEFGQLEENAEYENAKAEQAKLESEIAKLENTLRNAQILDKAEVGTERVELGTTVVVDYLDENRRVTFEIVSTQESDPFRMPSRVSEDSPVGTALMNKQREETVEVETPMGLAHYKVVDIINHA
jgi:transcription elongation factor GreA